MHASTLKAWFSSNGSEWATPQWLFDRLNFVHTYTLDVCASDSNHKCERYYTREDDCFTKPWTGHWWCNPVYGDPEQPCTKNRAKCKKQRCGKRGFHVDTYQPGIIDFVDYGLKQAYKQNSTGTFLVPARVDTEWFYKLFNYASQCLFLKGRLCYNDGKQPAPFPSAVVHVDPRYVGGRPSVDILNWRKL